MKTSTPFLLLGVFSGTGYCHISRVPTEQSRDSDCNDKHRAKAHLTSHGRSGGSSAKLKTSIAFVRHSCQDEKSYFTNNSMEVRAACRRGLNFRKSAANYHHKLVQAYALIRQSDQGFREQLHSSSATPHREAVVVTFSNPSATSPFCIRRRTWAQTWTMNRDQVGARGLCLLHDPKLSVCDPIAGGFDTDSWSSASLLVLTVGRSMPGARPSEQVSWREHLTTCVCRALALIPRSSMGISWFLV
jgi:hypothetical protein